jgi:hypothetical protein
VLVDCRRTVKDSDKEYFEHLLNGPRDEAVALRETDDVPFRMTLWAIAPATIKQKVMTHVSVGLHVVDYTRILMIG